MLEGLGGMTLWAFVLQIIVLYVAVMVSLRIMGKREIGQLSVFDFVVSVMIAELSTLPMEDTAVPAWRSLLAILVLVVLQLIVAFLSLRSHRIRHWVEGEPSVLIEHGKIKDDEMRKTRYSMHDLLMQLRQKGVADLADVEFAILETSGQLSVFPSPDARPVTPADLKVKAIPDGIPLPLVIDGNVVKKTLQILERDESWVAAELDHRGYGPIHSVFYAAVDLDGNIYVDSKDSKAKEMNGEGSRSD